MEQIVLSRAAKARCNSRVRAIVALGLVVLVAVGVTSTGAAAATVPENL